jgi:hypothetical protein
MCCKQARLFYKTSKYFHINKNNTGHHKALSLSLTHLLARANFAQPQSKCLLLLCFKFISNGFLNGKIFTEALKSCRGDLIQHSPSILTR